MNVKTAKNTITEIMDLCKRIEEFDSIYKNDINTGFLCDAVAYLCDYRKILENAIDNAELNI